MTASVALAGPASADDTDNAFLAALNNNNIPYVNNTIPAGIMADEILTPGPGKVRAMLNMSGNPLLSCANSERLATAFADLELFVCLDIVRNETAEYADYVLPGLHALERADIPSYFFTMMGLMPTRSFSYTDAVLTPPGECRDEGLILRQLCRAVRPAPGQPPVVAAADDAPAGGMRRCAQDRAVVRRHAGAVLEAHRAVAQREGGLAIGAEQGGGHICVEILPHGVCC